MFRLIQLFKSPLAQEIIKLLLTALAGGMVSTTLSGNDPIAVFRGTRHADPKPADDPQAAIGRISFGSTGCTATVVGPVNRQDRELWLVTAAHCVKVGAKGTFRFRDGRQMPVECVSRNPQADVAWLKASRPEGSIPWLFIAASPPAEGADVFHCGFGVHVPGNKEVGKYLGISQDGRQCMYKISVSPGDSGGGIVLTSKGYLLSPVCCTTRLAGVGTVWGGTPAEILATKPSRTVSSDEPEWTHPIQPLPHPDWPNPELFQVETPKT